MAYELLSQSRKLNKREEWGEGAPNNSGRVGNPQRRRGGGGDYGGPGSTYRNTSKLR